MRTGCLVSVHDCSLVVSIHDCLPAVWCTNLAAVQHANRWFGRQMQLLALGTGVWSPNLAVSHANRRFGSRTRLFFYRTWSLVTEPAHQTLCLAAELRTLLFAMWTGGLVSLAPCSLIEPKVWWPTPAVCHTKQEVWWSVKPALCHENRRFLFSPNRLFSRQTADQTSCSHGKQPGSVSVRMGSATKPKVR